VAEGPRLVILNPILDGGAEETPAGLELLQRLEPRIETSCLGGVDEARDEIRYNLMALSE
jgi:hypothetical protein